jgi:hypothetical protein
MNPCKQNGQTVDPAASGYNERKSEQKNPNQNTAQQNSNGNDLLMLDLSRICHRVQP